jgi:hypothetical protein
VTTRLDLQAVGAFIGLSKATTSFIETNMKFQSPDGPADSAVAEVLAVRAAEPVTSRVKIGPSMFAIASLPERRVPAIIRVTCAVRAGVCTFGDTAVAQNATITLPLRPSQGRSGQPRPDQVTFVIDQLFPAGSRAAFPSVVTARARFVGGPELLSVMKVGDVDLSVELTETERSLVLDTSRAVLTAVGSEPQTMNALITNESLLRRGLQLQQPVLTFTGTLRIPVVFTPSGWSYKGRLVKVGAAFSFESVSGAMTGWILDVKPGQETGTAP